MTLFTSKYRQQRKNLTEALDGIASSGSIKFNFIGGGQTYSTPVDFLPVDCHEGKVHGIFRINGKVLEAPIGFTRNIMFFKEYYLIKTSSELERTGFKLDEGLLYLPLGLCDIKTDIFRDGNIVEGSPFPVYGIQGRKRPLWLIREDENAVNARGIYLNKDSEFESYGNSSVEKRIGEFLRNSSQIEAQMQK